MHDPEEGNSGRHKPGTTLMGTLISNACIVECTGDIMEQTPLIRNGDPAPNFSLKDQDDKTFDLFEQSGKTVLLSFHPLAWTPFCASQMQSLEENRDSLASLDTIALGISVDSVPCKKAWAQQLGITHTPLLCDFWPHGRVATAYGIFRDANGFSERSNIIIDENQRVIFVKIYPVHSVPDIREIIAFLRQRKPA
jgi:peroxiredoxin